MARFRPPADSPTTWSSSIQSVCEQCTAKTCIEMCSGQAITRGDDNGVPAFDREKCIHCGACIWNCGKSIDGERTNIDFRAGAGGLHSAEN